jgi:hypothetical protein
VDCIGEVGDLPTELMPVTLEKFLPTGRVTVELPLHEHVKKMILKKSVGLDETRQHAHRSPAEAAPKSTDHDLAHDT